MLNVPLFDRDGTKVGELAVDESVFGKLVRKRLLHRIVIAYEANRRVGTHSVKRRNEVHYSDRKPWPQKHTGRARAGTKASPLWRHGGVAMGPKPRDYRQTIPVKERRVALASALLGKLKDGEVRVIEGFEFPKPSTKRMAALLGKMGCERSVLIGIEAPSKEVYLSVRNLPRTRVAEVREFNAYDVIRHKDVIVTRQALTALGPKDRPWIQEAPKAGS